MILRTWRRELEGYNTVVFLIFNFFSVKFMSQVKSFLERTTEKAQSVYKHIVLPEGSDARTIAAAAKAVQRKLVRLTILGNQDNIFKALKSAGVPDGAVAVIDPKNSPLTSRFAKMYYELRRNKGLTEQQAEKQMLDEMYFGTMMVKTGAADGLVSGAVHSTPDTIRPALQIIKAAKGVQTVSSMFFMCRGEMTLLFADSGLNQDPNAEQVADIALSTAKTALQFGIVPRIAMLSYSTKGSAKGAGPDKMIQATRLAKEKIAAQINQPVAIDGELQFDAAFVPAVAAKKCPDSPLKGQANVFIFPDLGVGNIAYKMAERLAGMEAYGPILQGLARPVNDLSRGCNADDIFGTIAITAIQACG